ncbi:hypothetical protein CVT26_014441 [Gymnopilus dilepis]|uniref:Uncharacterized protein n=1 Tax=Gymnopilus dilepis TaxID=231916 RepID=A0A409VV80_9AGAR|nr:hypothetical protein CVT26_014441 [Gymnopilus dilepis]
MSTSSLPSAWEEPRQFTIPLPFDYDPNKPYEYALFACSATTVVVGYANRVYIYSLPTFDLVRVLKLGDVSNQRNIEIHGELLVVNCSNDPDGLEEGCLLHFWDLSAARWRGTMALTDYWNHVSISCPMPELIETEENGEVLREEWPKIPTWIIVSPQDQFLRTYTLDRSLAKTPEYDVTEVVEGSLALLPVTTIYPFHPADCHASMGRTAVSGGVESIIRSWDVITGECQLVLIGHRSTVIDVRLDESRIYSFSYDWTVRVWDRHSGGCLHVPNFVSSGSTGFASLDIMASYLITSVFMPGGVFNVLIWDPISRNLVHEIGSVWTTTRGPVRGEQDTLVTWEFVEGSSTDRLKLWDVRTGQLLMSSAVEWYRRDLSLRFQDQFIMALDSLREEHRLRVWDFGTYDSLDARDGSRSRTGSKDEIIYKTEVLQQDVLEETTGPSSSSDVVDEVLAEGSVIFEKRKNGKGKNFIRRLFRRR